MRLYKKIFAMILSFVMALSSCIVSFAEENVESETVNESECIEETEDCNIEAKISYKFDFGNQGTESGFIGVSATEKYSASVGYGFSDTSKVKNVLAGGTGALKDAVAFASSVPFNVDLPNGVYKITVTTGNDYSTIIRAEGYPQLLFMTGNNAVDSFTIPVSDGQLNINASTGVSGHEYSISTLEITQVTANDAAKSTIWTLGDATVASYYNVADDVKHGWGQYLGDYVDASRYNVRNMSVSSISAKVLLDTFFSTVEYYGKEGDICVLALGMDEYVSAYSKNQIMPDSTEYKKALTEMIRRAKAKGMKVYLVKQQGEFEDCVKYPLITKRWFNDAIDEVAKAEQVEVIDLFHAWLTYCLENNYRTVKKYYTSNNLHLNLLGAQKLAKMMQELIFAEPEKVVPAPQEDPLFNTSSTVVYETEVSGAPIANPHKGFVITAYNPYMISSEFEYGIGGSANNKAWDVVTICNGVHYWEDINPKEGVYNWKEIDDMLDACEKNGMTYVIRILPYSHLVGSHDNYGAAHNKVPQWVFDKGAELKRVTLYADPSVEIDVPVWDDYRYIKACEDLATALAEHYDGDPRVEFIDIRPFGNWGEWHNSQFVGIDMPSVQVQKDMLKFYSEAFDKTLLAVPSGAWGEVYEYARSLGIAKRLDGMISSSNEEWSLLPSYKDNIPALAENTGPYSMLLQNDDGPYGPLKWTPTRFRECIEIPHLTITALDQDSHCGYEFYKEQKAVVDEMVNRIGYNFTVTSAKRNGNKLQIKIKNTGVAPSYFNIKLCAEITDAAGNKKAVFGEPVIIEKGTFHDDTEQIFVFEYNGTLKADDVICLAMYDCDNSLVAGKDPTVRFDNKNNLSNNRLMLGTIQEDVVIGWQNIDGKWYYINSDGTNKVGWLKYSGAWYLFDKSGVMQTGWKQDAGSWYYLLKSGKMATGWQSINDKWYYFGTSGVMTTGWKKIKDIWYYFGSSGAMATGWKQIKDVWYYFDDGAMVTGWKKINNIWYYFDDGAMAASKWISYGNAWYYFDANGAMVANKSITINGKTYKFDAAGVWIK